MGEYEDWERRNGELVEAEPVSNSEMLDAINKGRDFAGCYGPLYIGQEGVWFVGRMFDTDLGCDYVWRGPSERNVIKQIYEEVA